MLLARTLWHIETHLDADLTLIGVAGAMEVSQSYLTRAFATVLGQPLMAYVRTRRLSRAALWLAAGRGTVIEAALDAGYGSPEAFARAFRAAFGVTPGSVLRRRSAADLPLVFAQEIAMTSNRKLAPPRIEEMPERRILGPMVRYTMESRQAIPSQWAALNGEGMRAEGALSEVWYGVCRDVGEDGAFDYLSGQEVPKGAPPSGWAEIRLPAGRWARFSHDGHVSEMPRVLAEVFGDWLGQAGLVPRQGPAVEVYPPGFDGDTGLGGFEVWVPVA